VNGRGRGAGQTVDGGPWLPAGSPREAPAWMTPSVGELRRRFIAAEQAREDGGIIVTIGDMRVVVAPKPMSEERGRTSVGQAPIAKVLLLGYAGLAYLAFVVSFVWLVGFLLGLGPTRGVDEPAIAPLGQAVLIDVALLLGFAVQHSIMARAWFKELHARVLPEAAERASFVLASALAVMLLSWQWQPIAGQLWAIEAVPLRVGLTALSVLAWVAAGLTTFIHDHLEFFGLRQAWDHLRGLKTPAQPMRELSAYRYVRHPMMTLILLGLWLTPTMTLGHLLVVLGLTAYVVIGLRFEERALRRAFGPSYADYQRRVPMLIPRLWPRRG
jgi:protein-S-isoprenylcysteine O-methyltransferase Ste14